MKITALTEMFQETDGGYSFARIACGAILLGWMAWVSYVTIKTAALPANMWEVSAPVSTLYGLNKITAAVAAKKDEPASG